tara:strand:+ start:154 stop:513 length:360 start_codon:yes stop_codon:yes gene_type:complete
MTIENLVGTYNVVGSNQDATENIYKGTLTLSLNSTKRIIAKWFINNEQEQIGTGFFKNNILVINFSYQSEDETTYKGVVVYQCISDLILDGFWSEKYGDPLFLGTERCFKIKEEQELLN